MDRRYVSLVWIFLVVNSCSGGKREMDESEELPPCQACKALVNSFHKGMEKTNKKHFGGGDTAWEEESERKQKRAYSVSEVRLTEIQEHLCSDVTRGKTQCYKLAEEWEHHIEEWWMETKTEVDLLDWLCVKRVEFCCPADHFGPECRPCAGYPDKICSNNGKCKGAGTRKGNGACACNKGYSGERCDSCASGHFESYRDNAKLLCTECHKACDGNCSRAGPGGCFACALGWSHTPDRGCIDLDECLESPCAENQFCVNSAGSFSCLDCDAACRGCHGDGPDMCTKCAPGYNLNNGHCEAAAHKERTYADLTRYTTYLGLCIATFIIFQKNTLVASIIGILVALYVTVSEYMLTTMPSHNQILQGHLNSLFKSKSDK